MHSDRFLCNAWYVAGRSEDFEARLTPLTLLNEMARLDVEFGLITVCAAGGMGFAMVLERR